MGRFFARIALSIAALLVMVVAAFIAVGFFALALYLYLAGSMPPPVAALITGTLVLLLAVVLVLVTRPRRGYRPRLSDAEPASARQSAAELGGELGRRLQDMARSHTTGSLLAALVAGFIVGVSPKLRSFLLDILKL